MGRIEFLFGPWGLLTLAVIVLLAIGRIMLMRRRKSGTDDLDGLGDGGGEIGGRPGKPGIYPSFPAFLESYVAPRASANPSWERLDGAYGIPGRKVATFMRDGMSYAVNGESEMATLMRLRDWIGANPEQDPLMAKGGTGSAGRLVIRPEVGQFDPKTLKVESV